VTRAGIAAAALLFVIILTVLSLQIKLRKRRYRGNESNIEEILKGYDSLIPKRYRYSDLKKITGSFKDNLGEGGYGTVFKGNLKDGRKVAVKLLKQSKGNGEEFVNEVVSFRKTSHVNIVNLLHYYRIGLCSRSFIPVTFGPGTKCGFCPGSKG